jgi:hypothetical protein
LESLTPRPGIREQNRKWTGHAVPAGRGLSLTHSGRFAPGLINKLLTLLLSPDDGRSGHCVCGAAQMGRISPHIPISSSSRRRLARWLVGSPISVSSGTLFCKRLPILMGIEQCRHASLASQYGHCGTRSPNIPRRVSTSLVTSAATRSIFNGDGPRGLSMTRKAKPVSSFLT